MTKIIAICNHKGGVGKTTTTASTGAALAQMGKRTLLIDLDPQANLTTSLLQEDEERSTIYDTLKDGENLPIIQVKENLYLVPSSLDLAAIEIEIASQMGREYRLRKALSKVAENYDYIFIDCPPSLGVLTINALTTSTDLYITLTAEALPTRGFKRITDIYDLVKEYSNKDLCLSGIIITRFLGRKLNKEIEAQLRQHYGNIVFNTRIRENISLAEAPLSYSSILDYAPDSNGAKDYKALAEEIVARS